MLEPPLPIIIPAFCTQ